MLTTLYLSGELGHRFGRKHKLAVASPAEALRALEANHPGFAAYLIAAGDRGVDFRVKVDGEAIGEDRVRFERPGRIIRISPVIAGRKSGVGQIIAGVVLVALAFVSQQYELLPYSWGAVGTAGWASAGSFVGALGLSMAFGGVSQLLAPMPKGPQLSDGKPSYIFNGPVNTVEQGGPVPLCYGTVLVGTHIASGAVESEDIGAAIAAPSDDNDGEGSFSTDPSYPTDEGTTPATNLRGRSLQTRQILRQIHLLSEGEVEGICDTTGAVLDYDQRNKGILLDLTPIQNADGSYAIQDVTTAFRPGLATQDWLAGIPSAEVETSVDVKVTKGSDKWANAVQREIPAGSHNALRVTVRFPALYEIDNKGNRTGAAVHFGIQIKRVAETGWREVVGGNTLPNGELDGLIQGEATQPYVRSFRIPLYGEGPWQVRVGRESPDSTDPTRIQNDLYWQSYTQITDYKLTYRHSALLGVEYSAERFANAAAVAVRLKGIKVRVPSNYDPLTRNYTGAWDGQFAGSAITLSVGHGAGDATLGIAPLAADLPLNSPIEIQAGTTIHRAYLTAPATAGVTSLSITPINAAIAAGATGYGYRLQWTNNPAWIYYDLSTHPRYGLGQYVADAALDKWALYEISRYCDGVDGSGNFVGVATGRDDDSREPRFACNTYLQSSAEAYQVLADLSSCFRGMVYWGTGFITAVQDAPKAPKFSFTDANVIDGAFHFSSTAAKARHTVCYVQWNDPDDRYAAKFEEVVDDAGLADLGVRPITIVGFGCTSRGQAKRAGLWKLYTERLENDTVTFQTGLEGARARPGDICRISARFRTANRMYGRLAAVDGGTGTLTLDAPAVIGAGAWTLFVAREDGTQAELGVTSGAGTHSTLAVTGSLAGIVPNAVFILRSATIEPALFRILNVRELDPRKFEITALLYNESKYDAIEAGLDITVPPTTNLPSADAPAAPGALDFRESFVDTASGTQRFLTCTWGASASPFVKEYVVEYRGPKGEWKQLDTTTNLSAAPLLVTALGDHSFRVFARSTLGRLSAPRQGTYTLGEVTDPATPTGLGIVAQGQGFFLAWTNPSSPNLTVIEIQESLDGTFNDPPAPPSPIVGTAAADRGLKGAFHRGGVTADFHRWYRIRARNASSGKSAWTSSVNATATLPPPGDSVQIQYSVDGATDWHDTFTTGDRYMRQRIGEGEWSAAIRIVGDDGVRGSRSFVRALTGAPVWSDAEAEAAITSYGMTKTALDTVTLYKTSDNFAATKFWNPVTSTWDTVAQVIDGNLIVHGTIGSDQLIVGISLTAPLILGGLLKLNGDCTICADTEDGSDVGIVRMNGGGGPNTIIPGDRGGQIDCLGNEYATGGVAGSILLTPGGAADGSIRLRDRTGADRIVINPDGTVSISGFVPTAGDVGVFLAASYGAGPGETAAANAAAIQAALDAATAAGGGTVVLPPGDLVSDPFHTSGSNVTLMSYGGTRLLSSDSSSPLFFVRHSGFKARGITFDGQRGGDGVAGFFGIVLVESTGSEIKDISFVDCVFQHSRSFGIYISGTVVNLELSWNRLFDCYCHIVSNSNADGIPNRLLICNNDIRAGYSYADNSGGIKIISNHELHPANGGGHIVKGNRIHQSGQMGIELWGQAGEDSVVEANIVGGTVFGISMDNASRSVVSNNRVYAFSAYGIEIATGSHHMNVVGNNLTDPAETTACPIAVQSLVAEPGDVQIVGNYISNAGTHGIHVLTGSNYTIIANRFYNCAATINTQNVTGNVQIKDNFFIKISNGGIFIDTTDTDAANFEITGNTFADSADNAYSLIVIYDGSHSRTVRNVAITDNRFMDVKYAYHPINLDIPPLKLINYVVERNFGSIEPSTYAYLNSRQSAYIAQPFSQSAFGFGHAFEYRVDMVIPAGAETRWYKLLSGGGGNIVNFLFGLDHFDAEGGRRDVFQISAKPYGGGAAINKMSGVNTGGSSLITQIIYDGRDTYGLHEVWIKVRPSAAATPVSVYSSRLLDTESGISIVQEPVLTETTTEPSWNHPTFVDPDGYEDPPGAVAFGFAYRKKWQITAPSSGTDTWVMIWRKEHGDSMSVHLAVENAQFGGDRSRRNVYHIIGSPYNFDSGITVYPSAWRNAEVVKEVIYHNSPDAGYAVQEIWLRLAPNPGGALTLWISDLADGVVGSPTFETTEPGWDTNYYRAKAEGAAAELNTKMVRARDWIACTPFDNAGDPHARLWIKGGGYGSFSDRVARFEDNSGNPLLEVMTDGTTRVSSPKGLVVAPDEVDTSYAGLRVEKGTINLAPDAVNPRWCKVMSADYGLALNFQLHIEETNENNRRSSITFHCTNGPYGQSTTISRLPSTIFNDGNVLEAVVDTPGGGSITEVWIKVRPMETDATLHFWLVNHPKGLIASPTSTTTEPTWNAAHARENLDVRYENYALPALLARRGIVSGSVGAVAGAIRARLWIKGNQPEAGDTARIALLLDDGDNEILDVRADGVRVKQGLDVVTGNYYAGGTQVLTTRQATPEHGATTATTDAPIDASGGMVTTYDYAGSDQINRALVATEMNTHAAKLNSFATKMNSTASKYNDLAGKYNELASRFNALLDALQTHGLIG